MSAGDLMSAEDTATYLTVSSQEYAEKIARRADIHNVPLRLEATATIMAGLATLYAELAIAGESGDFREVVNGCVNEVIEAVRADCEARR